MRGGFLPWVGAGVAGAIGVTEQHLATQPASVSLEAEFVVAGSVVKQSVRLFGPGDVVGIAPSQVIRTDPAPFTSDFEPNYLAAIEFRQPHLPSLFTPPKPDSNNQLRPWICRIVLPPPTPPPPPPPPPT